VVVPLLIATVCFVASVFLVRKRWRFTDTPTSDAAHVFPGLTEVCGTVEAIDPPANAPTDGADCVWWMYEVERYQSSNKSGHWVTEEKGVTAMPFHVRDTSGTVKVVLDADSVVSGAERRDIEHLTLNFLRPYAREMKDSYNPTKLLGGIFGSNELDEPISEFSGRWRASEHRLKVGDQVFLSAHARITPDGSSVELAHKDANGKTCLFELSVGDEKAAIGHYASPVAAVITMVLALGLGAFAGAGSSSKSLGLWLPLGMAIVGTVLYTVGLYNRVRRARERCHFAWSLIDVASEQRAITIPQLQTVVGAAFEHERTALAAVAAARDIGRRPSAAAAQTLRDADAGATQLLARLEALPTMKTQPNIAQLMHEVTLLTDRVAFGRRFYNDSVQRLADRIGQFPDSLFAKIGHITPMAFIDDLDAPSTPPPVAF
jgi:LemA protein